MGGIRGAIFGRDSGDILEDNHFPGGGINKVILKFLMQPLQEFLKYSLENKS